MTQLLPVAWQSGLFSIDEAEGRRGDKVSHGISDLLSLLSRAAAYVSGACTQGLPIRQEPGWLKSGFLTRCTHCPLDPKAALGYSPRGSGSSGLPGGPAP